MKTLLVPQFNEQRKFIGTKEVKVKNKMDNKDYQKVTKHLPGFAVGYCSELYRIAETQKPIEITRFYDARQRGLNGLKNYFITVKN